MSETTTETIIGGVILAAAVGFFAYVVNSTTVTKPGGSMELNASFRSVQGVSTGTDVRMAGVKIGTVTDLSLDPVTYRAVAHFTVPESLELATDSQALISSEGLLGGNFIEIVPGGAPENLGPGGEIEDTQGAVSLITLLLKFASGSDQ
ncbi:MAG: outer membrane lipid asymmetry maintenance protein MlaD [Paracoccaceae bacterium]